MLTENKLSHYMKRCNFIYGETEAAYHEAALKFGLTDSVQIILCAIIFLGDCCPLNQAVKITGMSKQTVNSALRKMEKCGIVVLSQATSKTKNISLTAAGNELAEKTVMRLMKAEDEIFSSWQDEEVRKYIELSEKFLHDLKEKISAL